MHDTTRPVGNVSSFFIGFVNKTNPKTVHVVSDHSVDDVVLYDMRNPCRVEDGYMFTIPVILRLCKACLGHILSNEESPPLKTGNCLETCIY